MAHAVSLYQLKRNSALVTSVARAQGWHSSSSVNFGLPQTPTGDMQINCSREAGKEEEDLHDDRWQVCLRCSEKMRIHGQQAECVQYVCIFAFVVSARVFAHDLSF